MSESNLPEKPPRLIESSLSFSERVKNYFRKEKIKGQEVNFDIYYSAHRSPEDYGDWAKRLKDCDIYIPEAVGWTQEYLKDSRDVSSGRRTPEEVMAQYPVGHKYEEKRQNMLHQFQGLYRTGKEIIVVDLPKDHPLIKRTYELEDERFDSNKDLESIIDDVKNWVDRAAEVEKARHEYILSKLKEGVATVLGTDPSLRRKNVVNIFMMQGSGHVLFSKTLEKLGEDVNYSLYPVPHLYDFKSEALLKKELGKEISNELAARLYLATNIFQPMYLPRFKALTKNTSKIIALERKMILPLTLEDIKKMQQESISTERHIFFIYQDQLKRIGIKVPQSEAEIDEVLARK